MTHKDCYTNIMLDLECAGSTLPDPVLLELAAVHFDLDTGVVFDHYSTIVNFESCKKVGLRQDQETMDWLNNHIPRTLDASRYGGKPLREALSDLKKFVQRCITATQDRLSMQSLEVPYGSDQAMVWGNRAVGDNVYACISLSFSNLSL